MVERRFCDIVKMILSSIALFVLSGCVLKTDSVSGPPGEAGPPGMVGPQGIPGISPFTYTNASMTDISYSGGRVGIGTVTPEAELQVLGGVVIGPGNTDAIIKLNADSSGRGSLVRTNAGASGNYNGLWMASNTQTDFSPSNELLPSWAIDLGGFDNIEYPGSNDTFSILRRPSGGSFARMMVLDGVGNVGIGTAAPETSLHVSGEVLVEAATYSTALTLRWPNVDLSVSQDPDVGDWVQFRTDTGNGIAIVGSPDTAALTVSRTTNVVEIGTLDITGTARLTKYSDQPFACNQMHDGTIALTSGYKICVCNGSLWIPTDGSSLQCLW